MLASDRSCSFWPSLPVINNFAQQSAQIRDCQARHLDDTLVCYKYSFYGVVWFLPFCGVPREQPAAVLQVGKWPRAVARESFLSNVEPFGVDGWRTRWIFSFITETKTVKVIDDKKIFFYYLLLLVVSILISYGMITIPYVVVRLGHLGLCTHFSGFICVSHLSGRSCARHNTRPSWCVPRERSSRRKCATCGQGNLRRQYGSLLLAPPSRVRPGRADARGRQWGTCRALTLPCRAGGPRRRRRPAPAPMYPRLQRRHRGAVEGWV